MNLKDHIRSIPDFPKPGILFYDISTLLRHAEAWQNAMSRMAEMIEVYKPDYLAGLESRGFLFAAPLALKLGCGFVMLRKPGKLPGEVVGLDYALEYRSDRIEVQADAVPPGARVVVVDDLLATGGTLSAGIRLLRELKAEVPAAVTLIELSFLDGRKLLDVPFQSLLQYES
ncbi:MAG TPA: adenine phosphoribosyltransferase [Acidisoma sp.]|jgi:adenine phosphoribosyltransferase|uniref:adenine phosphoribosyltransferase n=1 Tax=Acidisoma sp. TaxID=1872115 RepID=UPI002C2AB760|nr:adenine phosphoribosyltransferase [Acidisoma sp.]HTI02095.1 adenine phosphoribosyltransferase [Acidisoma sp.]